jgi:hypothetical protein
MKKLIIISTAIALMLGVGATAFAQKVTLHSASGVQHFTGTAPFQAAYTAAASGDTIYLPGGSFNPPSFFDKTLIIYGAGFYPDSTVATGKTFINGNVELRNGANNFYIEGVEITGNFSFANNHSVNSVMVRRCRINGAFNVQGNLATPSSNLSLIGNVFLGYIYLDNAENALLSNNIIQSTFQNSTGTMINNNVILGYYHINSYTYYLFTGNNNILNNNIIIWTTSNAIPSGSGNTFNKNLYVAATPGYGTNPIQSGNHTGVLQAEIFVNQTGVAFNYAHDYHLQAPATYLGTDGTQVGIYGGDFPWKEGAVPSNPHIESAIISTQTDSNGDLEVKIKVRAQ